MKLYFKLVALCIICMLTMVITSASEIDEFVFEYDIPLATVEFDNACEMSMLQKQSVADQIVGVASFGPINYNVDQVNNIICSLFGHDLAYSTVTVTHHKVRIYDPRCLKELYDVTYCTRCDYTVENFVGSGYISCHPEELPLPEGTNPTE